MKVAVIGDGAWGTAMAAALEVNEHEVSLVRKEEQEWTPAGTPDCVFLALPCQVVRECCHAIELPVGTPVVSLAKGIEIASGMRVSEILRQVYRSSPVGVLSGPSLAVEVRQGKPTTLVSASEDEELAALVQKIVHQKRIRVYRSSDMTGVELGGALKNVYAIAAGVCEGLRIGENAMAGLLTRSLAEMVRIATLMGAQKDTLAGLSGIGDLMLTAYSGESRNHQLGAFIGSGLPLGDALKRLPGVAEGVPTTQALHEVVSAKGARAPVLEEVYQVLFEDKPPLQALNDLMLREVSEE